MVPCPASRLLVRSPAGVFAPFEPDEPANGDVFAEGGDMLLDEIVDLLLRILNEGLLEKARLFVELLQPPGDDFVDDVLRLALVEGGGPQDAALLLEHALRHVFTRDVQRLGGGNMHRQIPHELLENRVARDEIRLAVDFDQDADAPAGVDVRVHHALGGHAAGLLGRRSEALLPQPGDGFLHVAARGLQGSLAVHHAGLRPLPHPLTPLRRYRLRHQIPRPLALDLDQFRFLVLRRFRLRFFLFNRQLAPFSAFNYRVGDLARQQPDGADGVVVAGDHVIDLVRIAVGVHDRDDGNAQLAGFVHGDALLARVNDEHRVRQPLHLPDAAQVALQLLALVAQLHHFLLGQHVEGTVCFHLFQFLQAADARLDGLEVGEHAAQPALVDVIHAAALGLFADRRLRLLLRTVKQNRAARGRQFLHELVRLFNLAHGFLQVDDVNAVALREDVRSHLGVPAARLVAEVHARFEQLLHAYDGHAHTPFLAGFFLRTRHSPGNRRAAGTRLQVGVRA